jgi:hypothetical protein
MASTDDGVRHLLLAFALCVSLAGANCSSHRGLSAGTGGAHGGGGVLGSGGSSGNFTVTFHGDGIAPMSGGGVIGSGGVSGSGGSGGNSTVTFHGDGIAPMSGGGVVGPGGGGGAFGVDVAPVGRDAPLERAMTDTSGPPDVPASAIDSAAGCSSLGSCDCIATRGCAPIAEGCWCPTECGIVCGCGGGRYVGCTAVGLQTCTGASDRVAKLCPDIAAGVAHLCTSSPVECITKCLDEVSSCADLACTLCTTCACGDAFSLCFDDCRQALRD